MAGLRARGQQQAPPPPPPRAQISKKNIDISGQLTSLLPHTLCRIHSASADTASSTSPILSSTTAFSVLLLVRLLSAAYATIPDCDEVFNFWEPTHYLSHNHGLQTWEYSPVYAIRSWTYIALHSLLSRPISLLPGLTKVYEFYNLRTIFALTCAYAETRLYTAVSSRVNRRVGLLYLVFTVCSTGMFHSSVAFLPSSFAMYTTMLATAAFLERRVVRGIFWTAVGGFLGWPFGLAMCIPFILEEAVVGVVSGELGCVLKRFVKGGLLSLILLCILVGIDSAFYHKFEIVPLNIVLYNVFSDPSKGPSIYGTEPWWFYLANLSLNFNLLLPLSLLSLPLLPLHHILTPSMSPRHLASSLPFYLWFTIFTLQPHKEERFIFLAYPALILNAATSYHVLLTLWGTLSRKFPASLREWLNWSVLTVPIVAIALLSLSRVLAVVTAYSAPMKIYDVIPANARGNLCLAGEWYRFPSSYFLPDGVRVRWVKSAFDGLLPGQFCEGHGWREGTWRVPVGMNDMNIEDPGKYIDIAHCDYFVELSFDYKGSTMEQDVWEVLETYDFLNAQRTPFLERAFWHSPRVAADRREWGEYRLFGKKDIKRLGA